MGFLFGKKKLDEAMLKTEYAAYRRKQTVTPDSLIKTLTYEAWKKQRKQK